MKNSRGNSPKKSISVLMSVLLSICIFSAGLMPIFRGISVKALGVPTADTLFSSTFSSLQGVAIAAGTFTIANDNLLHNTTGEGKAFFDSSYGTDYTITVNTTYTSGASSQSGYGIFYRATNPSSVSGYAFQFDPGASNSFLVRTWANGSENMVNIASVSMVSKMGSGFSLTAPHEVKITVTGTHHQIFVDGISVLDFTNSTYTSGSVGLRTWNNTVVNFHEAEVNGIPPYTVSFNANGGTGSASAVIQDSGTSVALPTTGFTKTGYTFFGWNTTASATTALSSYLVPAGGATLYAIYTPHQYTITYNANGGTGSMVNSSYTYGIAKALTINSFTRTGYAFSGWATSGGGTVVYTDGQSVTNLSSTDGATFNLYAKWANIYTIIYNGNGSTSGSTASSSHTYGVSSSINLNDYIKIGNTFLGWSTSSSAVTPTYTNGQTVLNLTTTPSDIVIFYAVWSVNSFNLTYDANGGTGGTGPTSTQYNSALTPPAVTRTGYTFTGWSPSVPSNMPAVNFTYTAEWSVNSYSISFDANSGTGSTGPTMMDYGSALTAPTVTRAGYIFTGWSPTVPATVGVGNATYTAKWVASTVNITFDANGGTPSPEIGRAHV